MPTILLFARDPGAANALIPLVPPLAAMGHQLLVFGLGAALDKFRQFGIAALDLLEHAPLRLNSETLPNEPVEVMGSDGVIAPSYYQIANLLTRHPVDLVLTGTGSQGHTAKFLWRAAREKQIPSLAIMDQWMNYGIRFSPYTLNELVMYRQPSADYMPDRILMMDEMSYKEALSEGIPAERLIVTGHPYFECIQQFSATYGKVDNLTLGQQQGEAEESGNVFSATRTGVNPPITVLFISEPIAQFFNNPSDNPTGYTEHTILGHLITALNQMAQRFNTRFRLLMRYHPLEKQDNFDYVLNTRSASQDSLVELERDNTPNPWDAVMAADLVCGMSSMLLLEAYLLGKPLVSVQIGLTGEDPFILSRSGRLPTMRTPEQLTDALQQFMTGKWHQPQTFPVVPNPIHNVLSVVEAFLPCNSLSVSS